MDLAEFFGKEPDTHKGRVNRFGPAIIGAEQAAAEAAELAAEVPKTDATAFGPLVTGTKA